MKIFIFHITTKKNSNKIWKGNLSALRFNDEKFRQEK